MEDLPFGFDVESDSDDDDEEAVTSEKPVAVQPKNRHIGKELVELVAIKHEEAKHNPETEEPAIDSDKTPELDTEAPVEHLSKVETEAINQTIAPERIREIQAIPEADYTPQDAAAENFYENVQVNGDPEVAFNQTVVEMGIDPAEVAAIEPEAETVTPVTKRRHASQQTIRGWQGERVVNLRQSKVAEGPKPESQPSASQPEAKNHAAMGNTIRFLLKRREARINSEKKIPALTARLEKEVVEVHRQLLTKEVRIRQLVEAKPKPELRANAPAKRSSENIGKVLVEAQMPVSERQESTESTEIPPLRAQTMNHVELLTLAQKIHIEGTTLRQIYESHLLGEKGLRRVIEVFLAGGNIKRSLRRELVEKEIDFERDPVLRDQGSDTPIKSSSSSIDNLLQQSGINWADAKQDAPLSQPSPRRSDLFRNVTRPTSGNPISGLVDFLLIIVILLLVVIIAVLLLK